MGKLGNVVFTEGDLLKVTIEQEGTKNVYIGRFLYFKKGLWFNSKRKLLVFRNHTLCSDGLFEIEDNDITCIKKVEEN